VHDSIEELYFVLHDTVLLHGRLLSGMAICNSTIHFGAVIDAGTVIILFLAFMNQIPFFLAINSLHSHSHIAHIDPDCTLSTLDKNIMLSPTESGTIFYNTISTVAKLKAQEQHIVLITKLLTLMSNICRLER